MIGYASLGGDDGENGRTGGEGGIGEARRRVGSGEDGE